MATEADQLVEQLKELVEGFKGVGQYAKDLASALAASTQPLQRTNDLTKAIQEQIESTSKHYKEVDESIQNIVRTLSEATGSMRNMNQAADESKQKLNETRQSLIEQQIQTEALRTARARSALEEREAWIRVRNEQSKVHEAAESMRSVWARAVDTVENMQMSIAKAGYETDKYGQTVKKVGMAGFAARATAGAISTGAQTLLGTTDAASAVKSIGSAFAGLAQTAGVGGLIGMMIYGKVKEAEFRAVGETAAQQFDAIGGHTQRFAGHLTTAARELSTRSMVAKEDLAQVAQAFAQTGVSADMAGRKVEGFRSIVGSDLIIATLAADKALELPAGTFAKLSGTLARDFNTSAEKAFIQLSNLGAAAKEAGMNAAIFLQQTMEVTSGLRLLNANADSAGATMLRLSRTMQNRGLGAAYSQAYAAAGMGNAIGAVSGMGEGLSAIIGERMGMGGGLDALYALKTGSGMSARGGRQLDVMDIMREARKIIMEDMGLEGQSRGTQAFAVQKLFGTDVTGADAILDAMQEATDTNKLSNQAQQELNKAFQSESQKTNEIIKNLEIIKDGISQTMVGLLGMVINGLKLIFNSIMFMKNTLEASALLGGSEQERKTAQVRADLYRENIDTAVRGSDKASGAFGVGLKKIGEGASGMLRAFDLEKGWTIDQKRAAQAAAMGAGSEALTPGSSMMTNKALAEYYAKMAKLQVASKVVESGDERVEVEVKVHGKSKGKHYDSGAH